MAEYRRNFDKQFTRLGLVSPRLSKPIQLDGQLDDPAWKNVPVADRFHVRSMGGIAQRQTTVRVGHNQDSLIFGARCFEPKPGEIISGVEKIMYREETFEIFLRVEQEPIYYYHFAVGPSGRKDDEYFGRNTARNASGKWNGAWDLKTVSDDKGWTAEIRIPYKTLDMKPPKPGHRIHVNFARRTSVPAPPEISLWSFMDPVTVNLHQPWLFGTLIFREQETEN